ncbi:hypothetical protein MM1S1540310_4562 [Mycobacteroides abscessus subsp. bolletii 1S-154-0310]|uniref:Uncharacterized protein n=3 Tax=Mycobacteroides abscessus TaxID=36809 RepID=A0A829M5N3_9MYCO|nr:hypothetical protein MA5S0304_4421 [Mycobacteroides abscessus 5S-0304]EIU23322.1 hypothetical protein MA5S0817_3970 [Mycobacteroides abscessus 5S-0817]EIU42666.1 hypothetical protein MA5S1215_4374 [Mycobacteroides abscessus 5S-1215]EIU52681.1 hypothetical protein MA6G1108_5157 [Mycobacteroides abscessus 6G-1108]EIU72346.1 hypothetical protein MM1S1520914_0225 [Mycobacteroides abscessus subsp. bolletii 1S-152-0914]EIU75656.1 hypothetical protein MM1S1540310_4562 [Mycobacteroides abscessus su
MKSRRPPYPRGKDIHADVSQQPSGTRFFSREAWLSVRKDGNLKYQS